MAKQFFRTNGASGADTPFDNIVGLQTVRGGGLTQGNFEFEVAVSEKNNRNFFLGVFGDPISLDDLDVDSVNQSRLIQSREFRVFPNIDLSLVTNFTLYGSLQKRIEVSIQKILNFFPAGLQVNYYNLDLSTGYTAYDITYDSEFDLTNLKIEVNKIQNPFSIDFTYNSKINLQTREFEFSPLRDLTNRYTDYILLVDEKQFPIIQFFPSNSLFSGSIGMVVKGNPFGPIVNVTSIKNLLIRPTDLISEKVFSEEFNLVEGFLLNRYSNPIYTATFAVPIEGNDGVASIQSQNLTFPLDGDWNLDIRSANFEDYLIKLNNICENFDIFKTNLVTRFLTTNSFIDFDTPDQKVYKVLQIYGRSYDQLKLYINALSTMTNVMYQNGNTIPDELIKYLAQTIGYGTNISPVLFQNFINSTFSVSGKSQFEGYSVQFTDDEINFQFYRNLILNAAYLFKSKGTRKAVEFIMRFVGIPEAMMEFNEYVYLADQRIDMNQFNKEYEELSSGNFVDIITTLDSGNTYNILGTQYTAFTSSTIVETATLSFEDYPVDKFGFPKAPRETNDYFFQKGAGWFESTPQHRSPDEVNPTFSVFTGSSPNVQTNLLPFTYGQEYFERFKNFPYMNLGYNLKLSIDNKKSWQPPIIRSSTESGFNAYYVVQSDKFVINTKNTEIFINPSQALLYDVWYISRNFNYPIPNSGLTPSYPSLNSYNWSFINPQANKKNFFDFQLDFIRSTINVRDRWFESDGKTSGYSTLLSIYFNFLYSQQNANVTNYGFKYSNLIEYAQGFGPSWVRLVEQFVPASTIWNTGVRYENSVMNRQKYKWKKQIPCSIAYSSSTINPNPTNPVQPTPTVTNTQTSTPVPTLPTPTVTNTNTQTPTNFNIICSINNISGCVNQEVEVPVYLNTIGTTSISAISLAIDFDNTKLSATTNPSVTSLAPTFAGMITNVAFFSGLQPNPPFNSTTRKQFRAGWSRINPVQYTGVIFKIRFKILIAGTHSVKFDLTTLGNCEFADEFTNVINGVQFIDGQVQSNC
jgi:hypothetical protein